jgi:Toprim-like
MIDVDTLKRQLDCRTVVEHDLGKPKYRTHDYSTFKCPFHQERKGYSLAVASIGSASHRHINLRWYGRLLAAPRLLVCMDADAAGMNAAAEIALVSGAARAFQVPHEKDVNAFYLRAGTQVATK